MKKILAVIIPCIMLLTGCGKSEDLGPFYLSTKYYGTGEYIDIVDTDFKELINNRESFAIFIYQPLCSTSAEFNLVLDDFIKKNNVTIYKMSFSDMKETSLSNDIKYYPSFAIYEKGKLVAYLDANSEQHVSYYKNLDKFEEWFTTYAKLKEVNKNNTSNEIQTEENNIHIVKTGDTIYSIAELYNTTVEKITKLNDLDNDSNLEIGSKIKLPITIKTEIKNITYDENKINIYFFWGDGCPHCEEEKEFFESISKTYGEYYNLHMFEVWYNEDNKLLMNEMASVMGDTLKGVPYTIVGDKSFNGFSETYKNEIISEIINSYKNSYDVYFENKD